MVERAKIILTKEKIDKQLAGQTSSTPFMSVRDGLNETVTFNTMDNLEQKKDRLTVIMGKLVTEDKGQTKPFKSQVYQPNRGRNQNRGNYQGRFRNNNSYRGHPMYNQNFRDRERDNFYNRGSYGYNTWGNQRYRNNYNNYRRNHYRGQRYDRNRSRSIDRQIEVGEMTEVQAMVGLGQDQEWVQIEIGLNVLSVESMTILLGSVLLDGKIGR